MVLSIEVGGMSYHVNKVFKEQAMLQLRLEFILQAGKDLAVVYVGGCVNPILLLSTSSDWPHQHHSGACRNE